MLFKRSDLLRLFVVEDLEIGRLETMNRVSLLVRYCDVSQDNPRVRLQRILRLRSGT